MLLPVVNEATMMKMTIILMMTADSGPSVAESRCTPLSYRPTRRDVIYDVVRCRARAMARANLHQPVIVGDVSIIVW